MLRSNLHTLSHTSRTFSIPGAVAEYERILARVNNGSTKTDAVKAEGLSLYFFSRKRCIAEAAKLDLPTLLDGVRNLTNPSYKAAFPIAGSICNRNLTALQTMSNAGDALPPKKIYNC